MSAFKAKDSLRKLLYRFIEGDEEALCQP